MYKKLLAFIAILLIGVSLAFAQNAEDEDPDEAGTAMPNVGISDEMPIYEVVEGVGTVWLAGASFRTAPNDSAKILRSSTQSEKVLIIGESGDWLKVRMYNNLEGYIFKKYVRMEKIFKDESTTTNAMNKKASFDIEDLIQRFNETLKQSPFALKYQIIPSLKLIDARKSNGKMTLTFIYSCVDLDNQMIPSYKENQLSNQMKSLLELIFIKLLLTQTESYQIVINIPSFNDEGKVLDTSKLYTSITMRYLDVEMDKVKSDGSKIWDYVESSMDKDQLFLKFP